MKFNKLSVSAFIFLIVTCSHAQDFKLGLRLESNSALIHENHKNQVKVNWPTSYVLGLMCGFNKKLGIEARVGLDDVAVYTSGLELDFLLRYNFTDQYYAIAGGMVRSINSDRGILDNGILYIVTGYDEIWPVIGSGYIINEKFSLELLAVHTNNLQLGYTQHGFINYPPLYINWLLKLGASYTIDL